MCTECKVGGVLSPAQGNRLTDDALQREKTAIEAVVSDLHAAVEQAHADLSLLTNKLEPGLSQLEAKLAGDTNVTGRGSSQLCYALEDILASVYYLQRRTNELKERVEL